VAGFDVSRPAIPVNCAALPAQQGPHRVETSCGVVVDRPAEHRRIAHIVVVFVLDGAVSPTFACVTLSTSGRRRFSMPRFGSCRKGSSMTRFGVAGAKFAAHAGFDQSPRADIPPRRSRNATGVQGGGCTAQCKSGRFLTGSTASPRIEACPARGRFAVVIISGSRLPDPTRRLTRLIRQDDCPVDNRLVYLDRAPFSRCGHWGTGTHSVHLGLRARHRFLPDCVPARTDIAQLRRIRSDYRDRLPTDYGRCTVSLCPC
jgi:hypothetical protein